MKNIQNIFSFKKIILITLTLFLCQLSFTSAQSKDPDVIIKNIKIEFEKIKDYKANVSIKIDAIMLKIPKMNAVFYFKQPNKTHIESNSFALIPKQGVNFSPVSLLNEKYTALYTRKDTVDGKVLAVLKIIPLEEDGNILLTTIWVDQEKNVVRKLQSTTKGSGTFTVNFNYKTKMDYPLPSQVIFSFNLDIPKKDKNQKPKRRNRRNRRNRFSGIKGKVILTYTNYKVNTDLPDSLFEKVKSE